MRGWKALITCLYKTEHFEEAIVQCNAALKVTEGKPLLYFLYSGVLFAAGKSKEALLQLENGLKKSPALVKSFIELNPSILQNPHVVDLLARYRKPKEKNNSHFNISIIYNTAYPYFCAALKIIYMNFTLTQIPDRHPKPRKNCRSYNGNG